MNKTKNVRAEAAKCLVAVLDKGLSLSDVLPKSQANLAPKDAPLLQEICFGVLRYFPKYDSITNLLLSKKLKGKQRIFHHLIIVGLYQIDKMRIPEHAAVAETVQATVVLKAPGLKGLVNACLRNFTRNKEALESKTDNLVTQYSHPSWFIKRIQAAYPDNWTYVLEQNLERSPMWLRVHTNNVSIDTFIEELNKANIAFEQPLTHKTGILLNKPSPVESIPGFEQGWFTVQDGAAQHAALLLEPKDGELILDACAAPGGKTCHVLDLATCDMVAADIDENRLERVSQNLTRLGEDAKIICGDLSDPSVIDETITFDRILLDAPCSATGVIRRHPDIKWLRRNEDIEALAELQKKILDTLWQKLKPGGIMLYATCSVLPEENKRQMAQFLLNTHDAQLVKIDDSETNEAPGWQILPGQLNMDGFYYCRLMKTLS
ncbi:16S rRNA (cytosine(967)-C(5))-methyltransferase RsmB [Psychrosphaera aquimarina]|uniref:16S rRNA (cytosine(967)-C(5))-methyltransferase n=1 Tax=Psychrosphaera aquimarina TaxID=2044854 RepID=A0ABU3QXR3_9GAMM|nr:16S rRNA (cytosine(967)-C(5))-methyltransferase RsmB [Psychrosphaera aquimarina]MDU0112204.1 16S rRNA (cytosine(967)-C(5))-methyltransferase RsmB [Psychrosphaera aquimarina]